MRVRFLYHDDRKPSKKSEKIQENVGSLRPDAKEGGKKPQKHEGEKSKRKSFIKQEDVQHRAKISLIQSRIKK
jgi:hypothetical protein